jgi:hypothetical protein
VTLYHVGTASSAVQIFRSAKSFGSKILLPAKNSRRKAARQLQQHQNPQPSPWLLSRQILARTPLSRKLLRRKSTPVTGRCCSRIIATVCSSPIAPYSTSANIQEVLIRTAHFTPIPQGCSPYARDLKSYVSSGVINLDKPSNPSSHEVVAWIKRMLR